MQTQRHADYVECMVAGSLQDKPSSATALATGTHCRRAPTTRAAGCTRSGATTPSEGLNDTEPGLFPMVWNLVTGKRVVP